MTETYQAVLDDSTPPRVLYLNWWETPVGIPCETFVQPGWVYVDGVFRESLKVPDRVTPRQARLVLAGQPSPDPAYPTLLHLVEAGFNNLPEPDRTVAKITWEYATEVTRTDALVLHMGQMLGLTQQQLDEMFIVASRL